MSKKVFLTRPRLLSVVTILLTAAVFLAIKDVAVPYIKQDDWMPVIIETCVVSVIVIVWALFIIYAIIISAEKCQNILLLTSLALCFVGGLLFLLLMTDVISHDTGSSLCLSFFISSGLFWLVGLIEYITEKGLQQDETGKKKLDKE